ncbi:MAG: hypothetical protein IJW37_08780 [Lachnospiraceae bacterium]|nr:hypothetical protein [Lachnospiraceae bacterium]
MKKKQEIRWTSSGWNSQYKEDGQERFGAVCAGTPLLTVCTLVFFCAAYLMLKSVFDWGEFLDNVFPLLLVTVAVSVLMEARFLFGPVIRCSLPLGVLLVGSLLFVLYLRFTASGENVLSGLLCMGSTYLRSWNTYYGTDFYMPSGDAEQIGTALDFLMLALCFLVTWAAKLTKERLLPAAVPLFVFAAELLVGYSPEGWSVLLMFAGVLLTNTGGFGKPEFSLVPGSGSKETDKGEAVFRYASVVGIFLLCVFAKAGGTNAATEIVTDSSAELMELQGEIVTSITEWEIWEELKAPESVEELAEKLFDEKDATRAELSNDTPEYENVPVLRVNIESQPYANLYFIGFYANEYDDGIWSGDRRTFEKACEKAGYDSETVAKELAELGIGKLAENGLAEHAAEANIYYYDSDGNTAYVPYFSEIRSEAADTEGDSRVVKEEGTRNLAFTVWEYGSVYAAHLDEFRDGEKKEWEAWYEDYVETQYLTVPKHLSSVETLAEELQRSGIDRGLIRNSEYTNEERLNKAYLVAEWLRNNTSYSLKPGKLPSGTDPINYFLEVSRTGYCMHYASAGTMLLRELGVPARYVSGYVANRSMFSAVLGGYEATVLDSKAHAWVEIYLEGIGWVPIEVTNGYSGQLSGGNVAVDIPTPTVAPQPTVAPEGTATPQPTAPGESAQLTTAPTPSAALTATLTPGGSSGSSTAQNGGVDGPGNGGKGDSKKASEKRFYVEAVAIMFVLPALLLVKFVVVPGIRGLKNWNRKVANRRLQKKMRRLGNRRTINLLNRKLYRKLRRRGRILKLYPNDAEYETILKKYRKDISEADWRRYMAIVKEAAFSYNDFPEEDVEFCYEIYQKVIYKIKQKNDEDE